MTPFRFVGTEAVHGGVRLHLLGQKFSAESAHGAALITEEEWEECGFTDDEVKRYASPGSRANMTPEFEEKLRQAWGFAGARQAEDFEAQARKAEVN